MHRPTHSRLGGIWSYLIYAVLIGVVLYFYLNRDTTPSSNQVAKSQQQDPESALKFYLSTAYHWDHNEPGGTYDDVKLSITSGDWDWFQANYDKLKFDPFQVTGAVNEAEGAALSKMSALKMLFHSGPYRPDAEIINKMIGDTDSTFTLKWDTSGFKTYATRDVHVVKEGELWKMEGFAGARARAMSGL